METKTEAPTEAGEQAPSLGRVWDLCPRCEEPIEKDDVHCGQCGVEIAWAREHCTCGNELDAVDRFCTQCGRKVAD
jgi:predicted amidophosphoribosyltransferase